MQLVKIGRRPSRKRQALDTVASAAKVWSEWQLAKRAGRGVTKGAKAAGKAAVVWRVVPVKALAIAGGAAAGAGALWAWRSRGGGGDDGGSWTPPGAGDSAFPAAATEASVNGPTAPVADADRITLNEPPADARAAAPEGSNGVSAMKEPPDVPPETPSAPQVFPDVAARDETAAAEELADDTDATKVSRKPADD